MSIPIYKLITYINITSKKIIINTGFYILIFAISPKMCYTKLLSHNHIKELDLLQYILLAKLGIMRKYTQSMGILIKSYYGD